VESASYLGIASLLLLAVAARRRVQFAESRFWWATLGMLVVLSAGTSLTLDNLKIPLPADALWHACFAFRMTRVPARFNLLAVIVAAVIASAGLAHMLRRLRTEEGRNLLVVLLVLLIVGDMSMNNCAFANSPIPPMPESYQFLSRLDPGATIVEVPQFHSGGALMNAQAAYWQDTHRLRTTAGYSGQSNKIVDELSVEPSPFEAFRMHEPNYVAKRFPYATDLVRNTDFLNYTWLYLTAHDLRYVMHHYLDDPTREIQVFGQNVRKWFEPATIHDDGVVAVYDRDRMARPTQPTILPTTGWGQRHNVGVQRSCAVRKHAVLLAYNPDPATPVQFAMEARAVRHTRQVRLRDGKQVLAVWTIGPGAPQVLLSPPFRLDGLQELVLEADGEEKPRMDPSGKIEVDPQPHAYRVIQILLRPSPTEPRTK
jgi:hypothetical protein